MSGDLPSYQTGNDAAIGVPDQEDMTSPPTIARSNSIDMPVRVAHTHFKDATLPARPTIKYASMSHQGVPQTQRPDLFKHRSFTQSMSSISLYSHFAGEKFRHKKNSWMSKHVAFSSGESSLSDLSHKEEPVDDVPKASVGKAMFMFLKAFLGSGVLFLPKAFKHGGIILSPILMAIIASICLFAFLRLVKTQLAIGGSYGDMGGVLYGAAIRYIVLFFIVISQLGFICSYFVFISGNLVNIVDVLSHCQVLIEQKYYIWFPIVLLIPLVLVRHIAKLSFTAIVADIFILFGLVSCLYFTSSKLHSDGIGPNVELVNPNNFALMIGTATFSFEGIGLVIPIVESMQRPERFPFVVTVGMAIVCFIYILIGGISYLAYGDHIQAAVVYNFPLDDPLTISVQLLYSIAIVLTAPLMLFPATKILEEGIFRRFRSGSQSLRVKWSKNLFRAFLVCICAVVAFSIGANNLDIFVSLVGSIACVPLCFIFPGMFHYKVAKTTKAKLYDALLCVFGAFIMVYTLYVSIKSFVSPESDSFTLPPYCPARN